MGCKSKRTDSCFILLTNLPQKSQFIEIRFRFSLHGLPLQYPAVGRVPLQHTSHAWVLEGCQNQVFILFCDDTCPDYPNQKHENHAHGERVEDQRVHDSDASLIGSVVRKQLVHLILAPLDAE